MLMCHYQWGRQRTFAMRCALAASFLILVYGMLASQSRSGLLAYLAGSLFLLKPRWRFAALTVFAIVLIGGLFLSLTVSPEIARFNLLLEARDTGGTGRAIIWAQLLTNLLRDPIRILWGNGPGAIDFYLLGIYPIKSAHSVYVEVLYSYGLIGIIFLVAWLAMLRRNGNSPLHEPARRQINLAIWFAMVVAFALDSDPPAAQILWLTPLLGALLIPARQPLPHPFLQTSSPDLLAGRALDYPETSLQQ
jgi:O-antigen ligase